MNRKAKSGIIYILIATIIYFTGSVIIALLVNPDYRFFHQFLSILGTGERGWIFNIPVMVLGLVSIPFYLVVYRGFSRLHLTNKLFTVGCALGLLTSIILVGIGYYPVEDESADIHNLLAFLYFVLLMIQEGTLSVSLYQIMQKEKQRSSKQDLEYEKIFRQLIITGLFISFTILVGLIGPSILAYTLQKVIVAAMLLFLFLLGKFLLSVDT